LTLNNFWQGRHWNARSLEDMNGRETGATSGITLSEGMSGHTPVWH